MKVKSIVGKLLLIGAIASMSCIPAFAAENNNKDAKDSGIITEIVYDEFNGGKGENNNKDVKDSGIITEFAYDGFDGDKGEKTYSEAELQKLPQVKFQKEDGKIVYKINNEKMVFDTKELGARNLEVNKDGSLVYLDKDGHKCEYKFFLGTINGEDVAYSGVFEAK